MARAAIRLRVGDIRFLEPQDPELRQGDFVVFESERGLDCSPVILLAEHVASHFQEASSMKLVRKATPSDLLQLETKWREEVKAHRTCAEKVAKHSLGMRLVETVYTFDFARLTFYYTADGRVDFRELLKDLTSTFRRTRIDLRQIGVRDETKLLKGVGGCGKEFCCATLLKEFIPITIKLAKDQGLSLNPAKLSGMCGRLKCCLAYEHGMYMSIKEELPLVGTTVRTPDGMAKVVAQEPFLDAVRVELQESERVLRVPAAKIVPIVAPPPDLAP
ncbi:MAG: stage 0 sporulation protein [Cyanobacteria bacterium NC_groundwater_1444_Ag_S-0.65um_54_12]|nr:stage 0 sporulation protein [Cyanobacteria bacterium NC_groundwater_1444_Ag_S-0.65um_54_12]